MVLRYVFLGFAAMFAILGTVILAQGISIKRASSFALDEIPTAATNVSVCGTVKKHEELLRSPRHGDECVAFRTVTTSYATSRGDDTKTTSDTEIEGVDFLLSNDETDILVAVPPVPPTGHTLFSPGLRLVVPMTRVKTRPGLLERLPRYGPLSRFRYRSGHTEGVLREGDTVTVFGNIGERNGKSMVGKGRFGLLVVHEDEPIPGTRQLLLGGLLLVVAVVVAVLGWIIF